jgi:hypothetical protein
MPNTTNPTKVLKFFRDANLERMKKGGTKKDACYHKAKAKYAVFPSAYASGYIAKCRKRRGKIK